MDRSSLFNGFRFLYSAVGLLIIGGGSLIAISSSVSSSGGSFLFLNALIVFITYFFVGGSMILVNQMISILQRIETNLEDIKYTQLRIIDPSGLNDPTYGSLDQLRNTNIIAKLGRFEPPSDH